MNLIPAEYMHLKAISRGEIRSDYPWPDFFRRGYLELYLGDYILTESAKAAMAQCKQFWRLSDAL